MGRCIEREGSLIRRLGVVASVVLLSACSQPEHALVLEDRPPATDALYRADPVTPGRLAYAPDRETFAPVLTEPFAYPTQRQAEHAWHRASFNRVDVAEQERAPPGIRLFGCKPGALDSLTGRITRYRGPVVHCAVDFGLAPGHPLRRDTMNFYRHRGAWHLGTTDPPRAPVAWLNREKSERDPWRFLPWRKRYE
ncbi:hypothetical protein [Bosea vaviloviae]|uniref:Lipoprotein n=1 Tax=Bosea vaviloviae TaxID=1526658 RepID=A0A1D7UCT6_9HYPH|nr:hypothetical protein [Bosea vaviloviae]AOO85185.1 hypothetical protein BHK69_30985 [Bosea vaviloviae]